MNDQSKAAPNDIQPTVAYSAGRKITLAPLTCTCGYALHACAVELLGDGDIRLICNGCHRVLLSTER